MPEYHNFFAKPVLALPRAIKRIIVLAVDISLCVLTVWLALYLRLGEFGALVGPVFWAAMLAVVIALPIFIVTGLYRAIFRYSGWPAVTTLTKATAIYGLIYATVITAVGIPGVPRTIGLIQPLLLLLAVGSSRALARFWLGGLYRNQRKLAGLHRVLVYGTGRAGRQLADALAHSQEMHVVGFLEDDEQWHGQVLNGKRIYSPVDLAALAESLKISDVLLALPSIDRRRRNEILAQMRQAKVAVRTLPGVTELATGKVGITDVAELDVDDLLGRDSVPPDPSLLAKNIAGKVVLVTGAGGSIGSELCRQIARQQPETLLLIEQSEFALYEIHQELESVFPEGEIRLIPLLASVCDEGRMRRIMSAWAPETIYHAAAYKHVPLVEHNVAAGIKNNVFGTLVTARLAAEYRVADFVLISTDKAVRPTNVMGASKRLAEMVLQAMAATSVETKFTMVRFGNVLGSSGSVVPKFRRQIRDGGPISLTHPEITRYFMTIPEAAQLVIQAGAMARGGDVFVLDMGEPVRIMELAVRMIELSGLRVQDDDNPDGDIGIEISGLRPGEKLFEELLIGNNPQVTSHPRIMSAEENFLPWQGLKESLDTLDVLLAKNDVGAIQTLLEKLVSGYQRGGDIVDWVVLRMASR